MSRRVLRQSTSQVKLPQLSASDRLKVDVLMHHTSPCILCGSHKVVVKGIFTPYKPARWGGQVDKARLLFYCLCQKCYRVPDAERSLQIEARIAAGVVGQRN